MDVNVARRLTDDLTDLLTKDEYTRLAKIGQVQIPGFSSRNIRNAPLPILKNSVKKKLQKLRDPAAPLHKWLNSRLVDYKNLSQEEFILKASLDHELSVGEKVGLFGILHSEAYLQHRETLLQNISTGKDPFLSLLDEPPSLADQLLLLAKNEGETQRQLLNRVSQMIPGQERAVNSEGESLEDDFRKNGIPQLYKGEYIHLLSRYIDEFETLDVEEQYALMKLAFLDLMYYTEQLWEELAAVNEGKKQAEKRVEELNKRYDEQNKELDKERENRDELQRLLNEIENRRQRENVQYQKQLEVLEREKNDLVQKQAFLQEEINRLQDALKNQQVQTPERYLLDQPRINLRLSTSCNLIHCAGSL